MKKLQFKLATVGFTLLACGIYFLIKPKVDCNSLGQIVITMLMAIIALQIVNIYLNLRKKRKKDSKDKIVEL